ncbi:otopetrin-1 [Lingula anatina]|uniref:Otopetrin-1 n=1 Tax=Lingula anatina TaxID=7574 RepID=A0A1S3JHW2_LINAN|nr:otopetrin-1 [Lingula anatina]|eukprot:XP_013410005.1 otopetrin-1 [Lingula anatina]
MPYDINVVLHAQVVKNMDKNPAQTGHRQRSALTRQLSSLYAVFILTLGLIFPLAAVLERERGVNLYLAEALQVYLYLVAIAYLLYLELYLLRVYNPNRRPIPKRHVIIHVEKGDPSYSKHLDPEEEGIEFTDKERPEVHHGEQGISHYLRLGAILFGVGALIYDGFRIAEFVLENGQGCRTIADLVITSLHLIFTFIQTFFLFKHCTIVINKHKAFARFGVMHLLVTNLCVWLLYAVLETEEDYRKDTLTQSELDVNDTVKGNNSDDNGPLACFADVTITDQASPYLYPCVLEYSILAAAVTYGIYLSIGTAAPVRVKMPRITKAIQNTVRMGCQKSNIGLFLGILVMILTLVVLSLYFAFHNNDAIEIETADGLSLILFSSLELLLLLLSLVAAIVGFFRLRSLDHRGWKWGTLNDGVMLIGTAGVYICNVLICIALFQVFLDLDVTVILSLVASLFAIFQASFQTLFISDGCRRYAKDKEQANEKPGRRSVVFLLICNLCMWIVDTLAVKKAEEHNALYADLYGNLCWKIVTHLAVPLIIYYRFHSAATLWMIWSRAYEM